MPSFPSSHAGKGLTPFTSTGQRYFRFFFPEGCGSLVPETARQEASSTIRPVLVFLIRTGYDGELTTGTFQYRLSLVVA